MAEDCPEVAFAELCSLAVWLGTGTSPELPDIDEPIDELVGNGNGGILAPPVILIEVMVPFRGSEVLDEAPVDAAGSNDVPPVVLNPVRTPVDV